MQEVQTPCPGCGISLKVPNPNNADAINCQCPKCGKAFKVVFRGQAAPSSAGPETVLSGDRQTGTSQAANDGATQLGRQPSGEATVLRGQSGATHAQPCLVCRGREYTLQTGRNIVGRKSTQKPADIMLDVDDRFIIAVTITRLPNGAFRATVQNYRNTNETHVAGLPLASGEEVILNNGTTIKMGNTEIVYRQKS